MSTKPIDQTTTQLDDGSGLHAETQAVGTSALTPAGGSHHNGRVPEPPTGDKAAAERQDPKRALEGGRTIQSPDVIAQRARDNAHVEGSVSGVDSTSPRQIPEDAPAPDGRTGND